MTHGSESNSGFRTTMPEKRIFAKSGHVCMMCGFKATTKNKYRELQDHLVRQHFQDRIKAALPTRRPFMCPDPSCNVEGKDWQALMRHYTGKHGVLEAYIKEFMASQMEHKENLHLGRPVSPLPPTNKIGCRRKRYKRHSSGDENPMAAEDRTEDTPPTVHSTSLPTTYEPNHSETLTSTSTCEYITQDELITTTSVASSSSPPCGLTSLDTDSDTILQLDDSEPAPIPPTHLALVLKKRKLGKDGLEEGEPEETYAFVDLKYFQPLSANQYLMKSQVIDSNLLALNHDFTDPAGGLIPTHPDHLNVHAPPPPPLISNGANGGEGGCYYLESGSVQSPVSVAAEAANQLGNQAVSTAAEYFESFPQPTTSTVQACTMSTVSTGATGHIYMGPVDHAFRDCYDQVVPNNLQSPPNCASEVEVSTGGQTEAPLEAVEQVETNGQTNPVVMQVPLTNSGSVATVSVMDPKGLAGRGCSKVVVETVKSIPMEATGAAGVTASCEFISHEGLNGMKEIDFTMF